MASFISDDELFDLVAATLHKTVSDISRDAPFWRKIVVVANSKAYNEIVTRLAERGFTTKQISNWDRGIEFQRDIGRYWALNDGAGLGAYEDKFIDKFDRRKELSGEGPNHINAVSVLNASIFQHPSTDPIPLTTGALRTTDDLFNPIDQSDPLRGDIVQW